MMTKFSYVKYNYNIILKLYYSNIYIALYNVCILIWYSEQQNFNIFNIDIKLSYQWFFAVLQAHSICRDDQDFFEFGVFFMVQNTVKTCFRIVFETKMKFTP